MKISPVIPPELRLVLTVCALLICLHLPTKIVGVAALSNSPTNGRGMSLNLLAMGSTIFHFYPSFMNSFVLSLTIALSTSICSHRYGWGVMFTDCYVATLDVCVVHFHERALRYQILTRLSNSASSLYRAPIPTPSHFCRGSCLVNGMASHERHGRLRLGPAGFPGNLIGPHIGRVHRSLPIPQGTWQLNLTAGLGLCLNRGNPPFLLLAYRI